MDFLLSGILARSDDAFMALFIVITVQTIFVFLSRFIQKGVNPMPIAEMALRPIVIFLCDKLNREGRSDFALVIRGIFVFTVIFGLLTLGGIAIEQILVMFGFGIFIDIILLMLLISSVAMVPSAYAVSRVKPTKGQYRHIAQSLNINMIPADEYGLRRLAVKALCLSLTEWMLAPILFFLIGGIPMACVYFSLSLFIRINAEPRATFVSLFVYLYRGLRLFADFIASMFFMLASLFTAGGKPLQFFNGVTRHGVGALTAFAYTQNLTLGGSSQNRHGHKLNEEWIGPDGSTAKITQKDVLRVIIHYCITIFLILVSLFTLYVFV